MSSPHDPKHPPHDHDHGHDHGHPHDHAHDHRGATATPAAPASAGPAGADSGAGVMADDAGSQALSEALRSSFAIVKVVMVLLVVIFLASGIFTVGPQEKAVILRFGEPVGVGEAALRGAGLHWAFPYPIDEVIRIPVTEIQTVNSTVGWYAVPPEFEASGNEPPLRPSLNPAIDGYTITGDGNIIHIKSTLRYRVNDPITYFFNFVNASNVVQNALNNALFHASARFTVDRALRTDVAEFRERVLGRVRELLDQQKVGVVVEDLVQVAIAPRQVRDAFREVTAADQERSKDKYDAQGYATKLLAEARGRATAIANSGQTDRNNLVQAVQAEAKAFSAQLPRYRANPDLFVQRVQLEAAEKILTSSQDKFYIPDAAGGRTRELRLQLSREPAKPAVLSTNQP